MVEYKTSLHPAEVECDVRFYLQQYEGILSPASQDTENLETALIVYAHRSDGEIRLDESVEIDKKARLLAYWGQATN